MDAIEYEVVWTGDLWRSLPAPQVATPRSAASDAAQRQLEYRARLTRLEAAFPRERWITAEALAAAAQVSDKRARNWLYRAARRGDVEQMLGGQRHANGMRQILYRRRGTQGQEAA